MVNRVRTLMALAVLMASASAVLAQQVAPHVGFVYPAGGRQGATFQVTVGGQFLDAVNAAHVSGNGVQATFVEHFKPITVREAMLLRDKMQELQARRAASFRPGGATTRPAWTAADDKELMEIRKKLSGFVRRPSSPAIAENVTLEIKIAADAPPGQRELRLITPQGLTNPLVFCVGQLPEFSQPVVKNAGEAKGAVSKREMTVTIPANVNGQIMPGGTDRFQFKATKGQHLVIAVAARELIPYLPDAVPGWFQASITLYDDAGRELTFADHFRFHPDPVLYYEVPADGRYAVEIRDSIYRGREDFVYRISIGELPYVTGIYPLGGPAGAKTEVELTGWNLPINRITMDGTDKPAEIFPLSIGTANGVTNPVPFAFDNLPECAEQEPNDSPANAQAVKLPIIINGRIGQPGDGDVFRIDGKAGQRIVAEVYARRLDSPLDSVLKLTDADGKQLAFNDDHEDKTSGLNTHHADSYLSAMLPADGAYYLHLTDAQRQGGSEYAYRLRISAPRPDFALRVVPSSIMVRAGATVPVTVYALRKDGYSGEIGLRLKDAPAGFSLGGAVIAAGQDSVRMTLTAPPMGRKEPIAISIEGRAMVRGQSMTHAAVPAEDMMQAFAYHHLVPAQQLTVSVPGRLFARAMQNVSVLSRLPVKIPAGGTARLEIALPGGPFAPKMKLELNDPPEGLSIKNTTAARGSAEIILKADPGKLKPGTKGNLIIDGYAERPFASTRPAANRRRPPAVTLPAIPFEVVAR